MSLHRSGKESIDQRSHRSGGGKNYEKLIGPFSDQKQALIYSLIEKRFELKKFYTERDWLT